MGRTAAVSVPLTPTALPVSYLAPPLPTRPLNRRCRDATYAQAAGDRSSFKEYLKLTTIALRKASPDAAGLASIRAATVSAIGDFLRHPDVYSCDLLGVPAFDALAKDAEFSPLHKLLTHMLSGDVRAFRQVRL